ncbi:MAG: hypothetical protein U0168_16515 [Nannocystaceae bacterium]
MAALGLFVPLAALLSADPSIAPTAVAPAEAPAVAPAPVEATPVAPAALAPVTPAPTALAPAPAPVAVEPMRDPFRPEAPASGWDTPTTTTTTTTTAAVAAPASTTTTTTTTTTITHRVVVPPLPPAPPPPQARKRRFVSGYGGFGMRVGSVSHRMATFSNIRGGLLLGERVMIGGSLVRMTKRFGPPIQGDNGQSYQLAVAYGGLHLGVVALRRGRFELGVDSLLGVGVGCIANLRSHHDDKVDARCVEQVKMFTAEPGAFMHVALAKWLRVGMNAGYRFVARERWPSGNNFAMNGGYFGLNLDFGWFARPGWR